ncbi:hypothetical protein FRC00_012508 [Tulasnella sp. 408]|nr:hypothetical protein FRC00_012508 [Tulasnella sp. 408]
MIHQVTNRVVIIQSANVSLALGARPILGTAGEEQEDLAKIPGGLLINGGTAADKERMLTAGKWTNFNGNHVVFDPVGVGATGFRKSTADGDDLIEKPPCVQSRGVDCVGLGFAKPAEGALTLYMSTEQIVVKLNNGCELLGSITGSGYMVGTAVATFCGAASVDALRTNAEDSKKGALVEGDIS